MNDMNLRIDQKMESRQKIIEAAATRIRTEGVEGASVAKVMSDAGLTHGGFYAHFKNKSDLLKAALESSLVETRKLWISNNNKMPWIRRVAKLARRYLTIPHRDTLEKSCSLAALVTDAARGGQELKESYQHELHKSLSAICGENFNNAASNQQEEALAFMALMIGGLNLSRAVADEELSKQILKACKKVSGRMALPNENQD